VRKGGEGKRWARWSLIALGVVVAAAGMIQVLSRPGSDPERLRARARSALANKDYAVAQAALDRLATLQPPAPADWLLRAQVAIGGNRPAEAVEALEHVPDTGPQGVQARLWEAYVAIYQHRARVAEAAILRLLKLDPAQVKPRRDLLEIYARQGRRAELDAQYRALAEHATLEFNDLYQWGHAGALDREPELTAQVLEQDLRADPSDRFSRLALAETLRRMGKLEESDATLSPLPATDPEARVARAWLARARGDPRAAEALLEPLGDAHPGAARLRGLLDLERGDGSAAARHYRAALAADLADRDALFGLGQALRLINDSKEAELFLRAAYDRDHLVVLLEHAAPPSTRKDPKVLRHLGAACEHLGRMPEARGWYRLAIAGDPLDPESQQALAHLEAVAAQGKDERER
jgi:tetratricopeptide (TPR) repeat protein